MHARTNANAPSRDSPAVILVHGMVVSSRYMEPALAHLAPLCKAYAIDVPGYGKSFKPPRILDVPQLANVLAEWMDVTGISKAHLAGNSFGCQVLAEFALRYRERVDRLVLVGPTVNPAQRTLWRQLRALLRDSINEPPSLVWISLLDYKAAGLKRAWATVKLPHIQAPTMVIRGAKDPLVPQEWAEAAACLLPLGELCVIPGAGHVLNYSAPAEFVRVMRPFLQL
jgi:2-hydroxy-6-oxonona-2,4-dienedioate hydrolase